MTVWLLIRQDLVEESDEPVVKVFGSYESAAKAMRVSASELEQELLDADYELGVRYKGDSVEIETWASLTKFSVVEQEVLV